ncbi:MAG: glycerophosphodiester phosphodiesterase family protein [Candidatus Thiodiazotropha lotti]|uniref:glycerophosphodiester phosphodiesterase n=1 Tax=Candidatus Thiodiazotropha lotti TaxID=2792787 RepID=A0A9E4K9G4_9GAMM|nr:glycerophosphodiester phosphodiesterase [Candidatus Thiodiazotropha lotti]ODC00482.1 glycerophosphodiester phosphodiesterase [Candidatus Thiodiazotropha endoloripes]MCG7922778.1 glycerophosphodiester phosphodiesterase [Candidatus Thiodiazotropha lotti]MCG7928702.1 glycerophosphodiester phosphodiesterase [Candidatus Thiodiazotropha lotti]MCG7941246.1 glycerophosphodiester phosphodiesterase [Candidatus Thiodiazotropha lotti]
MRLKKMLQTLLIITTTTIMVSGCFAGNRENREDDEREYERVRLSTQLGPRPFYLVNDMDESELKQELQACSKKKKFKKSDFSIGHRGAAMQFPEHTVESYVAAARMGAGILECDVTFTKDRELVCRHSQCDLHTTTNILATPLAAKCSQPFVPAELDPTSGEVITPASARCCTSDITLEEFKTLQGKMDAADRTATSVEEYLDATPSWRTDLYTGNGTLMTHAESIELFKQLGTKMTPELKSPSVDMPFEGDYTQQDYAQQMIDEYKAAGVKPKRVFAQSFNLDDVLYWINHEPRFGRQAVYLDGSDNPDQAKQTIDMMSYLAEQGVNYLAPAMWALVTAENGEIVPSEYAIAARAHGIDLITWTLERSGLLASGGGWYYQSISDVTDNDGDMLVLLDVLAQDVGIKGIFSDWPATVTFYANCKGL